MPTIHSNRRRRRNTAETSQPRGFQSPRQQLVAPYPPMELLSAGQIESIHQASLTILSEIGIDFLLSEARDMLKKAGTIYV